MFDIKCFFTQHFLDLNFVWSQYILDLIFFRPNIFLDLIFLVSNSGTLYLKKTVLQQCKEILFWKSFQMLTWIGSQFWEVCTDFCSVYPHIFIAPCANSFAPPYYMFWESKSSIQNPRTFLIFSPRVSLWVFSDFSSTVIPPPSIQYKWNIFKNLRFLIFQVPHDNAQLPVSDEITVFIANFNISLWIKLMYRNQRYCTWDTKKDRIISRSGSDGP